MLLNTHPKMHKTVPNSLQKIVQCQLPIVSRLKTVTVDSISSQLGKFKKVRALIAVFCVKFSAVTTVPSTMMVL
jgi:hypothetical protein